MLVLNTNQGGSGGAYKLSNQFLFGKEIYPDFDNSFLGFIKEGELTLTLNGQIATETAVETINGTPINHYFGNVVLPDYYTGINGSTVGNQNFTLNTPAISSGTYVYSNSIRFGTDLGLEGGEIIGKRIIAGAYGVKQNYSTQRGVKGSLSMSIGLLHTDGTITTIGSIDFGEISGSNLNAGQIVEFQRKKEVSTNGVVAQTGDRIICDYAFTLGIFGGSFAAGKWAHLDFGNVYTNADNSRFGPLQISID